MGSDGDLSDKNPNSVITTQASNRMKTAIAEIFPIFMCGQANSFLEFFIVRLYNLASGYKENYDENSCSCCFCQHLN